MSLNKPHYNKTAFLSNSYPLAAMPILQNPFVTRNTCTIKNTTHLGNVSQFIGIWLYDFQKKILLVLINQSRKCCSKNYFWLSRHYIKVTFRYQLFHSQTPISYHFGEGRRWGGLARRVYMAHLPFCITSSITLLNASMRQIPLNRSSAWDKSRNYRSLS